MMKVKIANCGMLIGLKPWDEFIDEHCGTPLWPLKTLTS